MVRLAMTRTPWGGADTLRDRKLRPGPGMRPEDVEQSQKERLFAAMVAVTAEKGYGDTAVADLVSLSGVSRSAFYKHFRDRQECFLATMDAIVAAALAIVASRYRREEPWEARARNALATFIELLVDQPAASRLVLIESFAAGPEAIERIDRAIGGFERLASQALEQLPDRAGMPPQMVRAVIGGLRNLMDTRLRHGRECELVELAPQLLDLCLAYRTPPEPLRMRRRGARAAEVPVTAPPRDGDPAERIVAATAATVAAEGYGATKVAEIADAASISLSTFYEHFDGKEEALAAALDAGQARMLAAAAPAYRRARSWPEAVRAAIGAIFRFLAGDPDFARLGTVEVYGAGGWALERRDITVEYLERFLAPGFELAPAAEPVAGELIVDSIYAMVYDRVRTEGPQTLLELAPLATYLTLAPFIGAEKACEVANGRPADTASVESASQAQ